MGQTHSLVSRGGGDLGEEGDEIRLEKKDYNDGWEVVQKPEWNSEIRLVRILPRASSVLAEPDLVQCHLEHFPLEDATVCTSTAPLNWNDDLSRQPSVQCRMRYYWGDFAALSYTWGNPNDRRDVVINGKLVSVGANLEAALRALRSKRPIRDGLLIWIDALCINQGDIKERNEEVKRMRSIYRSARDIVVWLGEAADDSPMAMKTLKTITRALADGTHQKLGERLVVSPDTFGTGSWRGLALLMYRSYWDRVWIIQEIAMGNMQTPVLCGDDLIRWGDIYNGIWTFASANLNIVSQRIREEIIAAGDQFPLDQRQLNRNFIYRIWEEHEVQRGRRQEQYMPMLDITRAGSATDPRDKVYGLLGLLPVELRSNIQPDYGLDIAKVYIYFARCWIIHLRKLDILEHCSPSRMLGLPSWVPDWTVTTHARLFSGRSCYHASVEGPIYFEFDTECDALSVKGVCIGTIKDVGSLRGKDKGIHTTGVEPAYGSEASLREGLWRTMVANRTPRGQLPPSSFISLLSCPLTISKPSSPPSTPFEREPSPSSSSGTAITSGHRSRVSFDRLIKDNKDLLVGQGFFGGQSRALASFFPSEGTHNPLAANDAMERIGRVYKARLLAVMTSGHLGLVPSATLPGDVVFLVAGCNVPIVFRNYNSRDSGKEIGKTDDKYSLVGGCYVHGFSEGEVRPGRDFGDLERITII